MVREDGTEDSSGLRIVVAQLGSRMHYAVPIAFYRAGILARLITDITADAGVARLISWLIPKPRLRAMRRLAGRIPIGVPRALVHQFPLFGLSIGIFRKLAAKFGRIDTAYICIGSAFAQRAAKSIPQNPTVVYGFNGASLELFCAPGVTESLKILEQTMAPRLIEDRLLSGASEVFPGWNETSSWASGGCRPALYQREAEEWEVADVIVCGSNFVKAGIAEAGGPVKKCVVVPYGVDPNRFPGRERQINSARGLNVLFVGAVNLRKGAPIVLEAARELQSHANIRMVGEVQVPPGAERALRAHVELLGAVPRSEMTEQFEWADIFLLPSYCEGSATVTYEAMASGLPQIVTANTGSYITDGREGRVVPIGDAKAIAAAVCHYALDQEAYARASLSALRSIQNLTLECYERRLVKIVESSLQDAETEYRDRP